MSRLSREKSPYLRHAAEQEIDWYPWSEEALQKGLIKVYLAVIIFFPEKEI
jgi:uncharacterized protein YyaL (SSP411 family)